MSKYPFLSINEKRLREFSKGRESKKELSPAESYVITRFQEEQNMVVLADDPLFREAVVKSLFPESIVNLLGGVDKLLQLPSFNDDTVCEKYHGVDCSTLPKGANIAISMDKFCRPELVLRLREVDSESECTVTYHSRFSNYSFKDNWVVGKPCGLERSRFYVRTMLDLPGISEEAQQPGVFADLKNLLQGQTCDDNGHIVQLCPTKNEINERPAKPITTAYNKHLLASAAAATVVGVLGLAAFDFARNKLKTY